MNYRDAVLLDGYSTGDADTTQILDLKGLTPISELVVEYKGTNSTSTPTEHPAKLISQVQVIDGSRVIADLNGKQLQALGYQGNFLGLDIWTTTEVPTANAGADRAGGVFGLGALGFAIAPPPETMGLPTLVNIGDVQFEIVRNNGNADSMTRFKGSIWTGASELIDAAGVSVITDA